MKTPFILALPVLLLSGCAAFAPSPEELGRLPVVRYGQPAPAAGDFVLLYPAGIDIPVVARVGGSLLAKTDQVRLNVQVKQDVYTYRDQVSFDGKTWHNGQKVIGGKFSFSLPGEKDGRRDGQSPGELAAEFNLK